MNESELKQPIPLVVTRWVCPYCHRSRSRRRPCEAHIKLCWKNPELQGCKTCAFFTQAKDLPPALRASGDRCGAGFVIKNGLVTKCSRWKEKDDGEASLAP